LLLSVITQAYTQLRPSNTEKVKKVERRIGQSWPFCHSYQWQWYQLSGNYTSLLSL